MDILVADDLFRFFHPGDTEVRALRGASLRLARGETVALQGPSGSGKSTLLACIAGLDEPDGGTVTIDGQRMTRRAEAVRSALRAASIGYLAQSGNLFAHLSVAENIALQMDLSGIGRTSAKIMELLALVGLSHRANALPETLSGGEATRAGLAVALATDPPLLLADEPTAEVDLETETRILDVLEQRRLKGGAALIATHSQSLALRATRVLAIADGRIVEGNSLLAQIPAVVFAQRQRAFNEANGITPLSIKRHIGTVLESVFEQDYVTVAPIKDSTVSEFVGKDLKSSITELEKRMRAAAADLEFEEAGRLRDEIRRLEALDLGLPPPPVASAQLRPKRGPEPMGPGGGGWDPKKRGKRGRR